MLEDVGLHALHQLHVVLGEFEGSPLEVHVSWGTRYHETEVYVDDVAVDIDEDVVVMSVLDVEQELDQAIAS